MLSQIKQVFARQILDSRGNPTVEVDVLLESGAFGRAAVPSGVSTGIKEALELRDGNKAFFLGKSVYKAVENVNTKIAQAIKGLASLDQRLIDKTMVELDGSKNKKNLGANAILGVSLATARAAASHLRKPFYRYLMDIKEYLMPVPMMNGTGICMSMGSACNSHAVEPSHVLTAIGLTAVEAESTLRISFGLQTTQTQVIQAANLLKEKVQLLRALSPQGEKK